MLDIASKLIAMNKYGLDEIVKDGPGELFMGAERPGPLATEVFDDLKHCKRITELVMEKVFS